MASNAHRVVPTFAPSGESSLDITITFYASGYMSANPICRLWVYHDALIENDEDDQLIFKNLLAHMKPIDNAAHVYAAKVSVDHKQLGKISLDVEVVKRNGSQLAKASYRLGVELNTATTIKRADRAPRMLHALNTAPGPKREPGTSHQLNDILTHVHAALTDNQAFRAGIASSPDGLLSNQRQQPFHDELTRVDEQLSLIITEKLLGLPYQMTGNVYGNCWVPDAAKKRRLVHLSNDVFWERMRPSAEEITYPWCTECQQLTTMVNYLRGVDIWALAPGARGELGAQRPSLDVAKNAGGKIISEDEAKHALSSNHYEGPKPLGPGDFFVFNDEKWRYKQDGKYVYVSKETVDGWTTDERNSKQELGLAPAQHPKNHPHISCILRVFKRAGNYFFQLMDTGGKGPGDEGHPLLRWHPPVREGVCDGRFLSRGVPDSGAAGTGQCVGLGVWPKDYKTNVGKLKRALERALVARPVALARLFLVERKDGAVLYATPLLRTYTEDSQQNFSPARLAWSLRNVPHNDSIEAFWAVWVPRGPLAKRLIASRHASLFDIRSEFAAATGASKEFNNVVLSRFPFVDPHGLLFMENINAMSSDNREKLHALSGTNRFRFPTDDNDPDYYTRFSYAEVSKIHRAGKHKTGLQLQQYNLKAHPWDQHIFGDRSIRTIKKQVTSTDPAQSLKLLEGEVEIDLEQFSVVEGEWYSQGLHDTSPKFGSGKVSQAAGGPTDGKVAASKSDPKQSVNLILPEAVAAIAGQAKVRLFVELAVPVIDNRYARPDKFDQYPYFRGDFPVRPDNCPGGNPGPDSCADWNLWDCPQDCAYIVKLRGLELSGNAKLNPAFDGKLGSYQGTVSYLDGGALTLTPAASCKATIRVEHGGKTIETSSGVESAPIGLSVGANAVVIRAEAPNGSSTTHTLHIERAKPSKEHSLDALTVSPGKLVQAQNHDAGFAPQLLEYELIDTQEYKIGVTPTLTNELATLRVAGQPHESGTETLVDNKGFGAHTIEVRVEAEDGNSSIYRIVYHRGNANNHLKNLQVLVKYASQELVKQVPTEAEQKQNPEKETYSVNVPDNTTRVLVRAVPEAAQTSRVFLNGKQMWGNAKMDLPDGVEGEPPLLTTGPTIALVEVEAQNGRRRTYELLIRRPMDEI